MKNQDEFANKILISNDGLICHIASLYLIYTGEDLEKKRNILSGVLLLLV